jgi:hypothetical protein
VGIQAWIDTVTLAPEAGPAKSAIIHQAYTLADPHVDPPLAPPGAPVGLSVKLLRPPGELRPVRIFARENRSHAAIELQPGAGASADIFTGTLPLDAKMATGETPITFVALRADPVEVRFDRKKADPMLLFVKQLDEMDPAKPYLYDPRIMASENRMVAKLTVLDPKQATQPGQLPASALKPPAAQPAAPAPQPAGPAK